MLTYYLICDECDRFVGDGGDVFRVTKDCHLLFLNLLAFP